ncbi:MAG: hypothetical protein RJA91_299 [Pseudomonadota bacterium]
MDDVHQYSTWSPEEIEMPWSIKYDEKALDYYKDSITALEEWRNNYSRIK